MNDNGTVLHRQDKQTFYLEVLLIETLMDTAYLTLRRFLRKPHKDAFR